jgi:hypothetical protein
LVTQGAWLKVILGPVLSLVYGSVALFLLVKVNGYITGFDVLAGVARAMRSVPDIKKISRCVVRRLLFGAFFGACQLLVGRNHYALAYRRL